MKNLINELYSHPWVIALAAIIIARGLLYDDEITPAQYHYFEVGFSWITGASVPGFLRWLGNKWLARRARILALGNLTQDGDGK
jgi:hypothetical protein